MDSEHCNLFRVFTTEKIICDNSAFSMMPKPGTGFIEGKILDPQTDPDQHQNRIQNIAVHSDINCIYYR
jgi:hypothetical protein